MLAACASMQSFTSARVLERPPYYDTYADFSTPQGGAVGHLPIGVDVAEMPGAGGRALLAPLLEAMNTYLDTAGWSVKLAAAASPAGAPWAYVGSGRGLQERSHVAGDSASLSVMVIRSVGPSRNWADRLRPIADRQHVSYVLAISLGPAEYYIRRLPGLTFRKELELGTGYRVPVGWLNDLGRSVPVLHLTGLLLTLDGKVLRAGAEGIMAKRRTFLGTMLSIQNALTEDDINSVLTSLRRDDLEGHPLVWQVALQNLVRQLLGAP